MKLLFDENLSHSSRSHAPTLPRGSVERALGVRWGSGGSLRGRWASGGVGFGGRWSETRSVCPCSHAGAWEQGATVNLQRSTPTPLKLAAMVLTLNEPRHLPRCPAAPMPASVTFARAAAQS